MADALKQDLVDVTFASGEMPDAYKLTGAVDQLKSAIETIDQAIGDIYSQQSHTSTGGTYELETRPLVGPNVGRLTGSAGWINTRRVGRVRTTDCNVVFVGHRSIDSDPPTIEGYSHYNRRQFFLPWAPWYFASSVATDPSFSPSGGATYWAISAPGAPYSDGTAKLATRVTNLSSLNANGEYHVSADGVITTYQALDDGEGFKVTYTFDHLPDSGLENTWNVIPDFSETTTFCTVALVSGSTYTVTLPTVDICRGFSIGSASSLNGLSNRLWKTSDRSGMYNWQAIVPRVLSTNLSSGDVIPAGYIQLYDNSSQEVVSGGTWQYVSSTQVRISGLSLTAGSDRYRLVFPGTNITEAVGQLLLNMRRHDHTGLWSNTEGHRGCRLSHVNLANLFDEGTSTLGGFVPSTIGPQRNPHPQYLHRYGYQYGESLTDSGNQDNGMLGAFVMSGEDGTYAANQNSFPIRFGSSLGAWIRREYDAGLGDYRIDIDGSPLAADDGVCSGKQIDYPIKWCYGTRTLDGTSTDVLSITAPSDLTSLTQVVAVTGGVYRSTGPQFYPFYEKSAAGLEAYVSAMGLLLGTLQLTITYGATYTAGNIAKAIVYYI